MLWNGQSNVMAIKVPQSKSKPEELFALQLKVLMQENIEKNGILKSNFLREYQFKEGRKWRIDFAMPWKWIAIEIEGGIFSGGRHVRGKGFEADCEKYNALAEQGWRLFRFTPAMVKSGQAIEQIKRVLQ